MTSLINVPTDVLLRIVDQLCECNYSCEAGHIEKNVNFRLLVSLVHNTMEAEPVWEIAPEWARFWAMDENGDGYWYREHPAMGSTAWHGGSHVAQCSSLKKRYENWKDSLRERPEAVAAELSSPWEIAPGWAKFWAVDKNGKCYWYKEKPFIGLSMWIPVEAGEGNVLMTKTTLPYSGSWKESLQERPETDTYTPDWSSAPRWAKFWAMDSDGRCFFYKISPYLASDMWRCTEDNEFQIDTVSSPKSIKNWKESLQERP